jgi:hypothetical protein
LLVVFAVTLFLEIINFGFSMAMTFGRNRKTCGKDVNDILLAGSAFLCTF